MAPNDTRLGELVAQAIRLSIDHVGAGGIPFTALIADPVGAAIGTGVNRVAEDHDPTAHAEVVAIRDATARLGRTDLMGHTLIASGEPCPLCYLAARWAGISRIVFAADRHRAARSGFDYTAAYSILAADPVDWPLEVRHLPTAAAEAPFELWDSRRRPGPRHRSAVR
ncbi:nucleoside deaminase [Nocardia sp. NPDC059239]|uniref:nucleoside deaminase n=1 Tax=Nocardia sp. NPDC059239 TaxID=3346785 RepID=UPI003676E377